MLSRAPGLLRDLRVTAARLDHVAFTATRGGGYGRGLPMNLEAIEAAATLAKAVGPWTAADAKHIGGKPWAVAYLETLEDATTAAVKVVDLPAELIHIGACGSLTENPDDPEGPPVECFKELFVTADATTIRCGACFTAWDVARRREDAITNAWNVLAPAKAVVNALATQGVRITDKHLENWQRLGHVAQECDLVTQVAGYRVADVYRVARRMEDRRRN